MAKQSNSPNNSHQILVWMLLNLDFFFLESQPSTAHSKPARKKHGGEKKQQKTKKRNNQNGFFGRKLLQYEAACCFSDILIYSCGRDSMWWTPPRTGPRRDASGSTQRCCTSPLPAAPGTRRQGWMVIRWGHEYAWASGWFLNRARVSWKQRLSPLCAPTYMMLHTENPKHQNVSHTAGSAAVMHQTCVCEQLFWVFYPLTFPPVRGSLQCNVIRKDAAVLALCCCRWVYFFFFFFSSFQLTTGQILAAPVQSDSSRGAGNVSSSVMH